jgi:hypothetical protein
MEVSPSAARGRKKIRRRSRKYGSRGSAFFVEAPTGSDRPKAAISPKTAPPSFTASPATTVQGRGWIICRGSALPAVARPARSGVGPPRPRAATSIPTRAWRGPEERVTGTRTETPGRVYRMTTSARLATTKSYFAQIVRVHRPCAGYIYSKSSLICLSEPRISSSRRRSCAGVIGRHPLRRDLRLKRSG